MTGRIRCGFSVNKIRADIRRRVCFGRGLFNNVAES